MHCYRYNYGRCEYTIMDIMKVVKTGRKGFITCWETVSKFACQKAHVRVQLEIKVVS